MFQLKYHHHFDIKDIENMIPWERMVYVEQVRAYINEERQRILQNGGTIENDS